MNEFKAQNNILGKETKNKFDMPLVVIWLAKAWNSLNNSRAVNRGFEKAGFRFNNEIPATSFLLDLKIQ